MSISVVIQQMIIIFILIMLGMLLYKREMLSEMTSRQFSGLIVNLTNPALLICSALREGPKVSLQELGKALTVDMIIYLLLIAVSFLIPCLLRVPQHYRYSYQMLTIFGNVGFIGIPLASAVLGTESLIFVSIYNLLYNVLMYTFGISILRRASVRQAVGQRGEILCEDACNSQQAEDGCGMEEQNLEDRKRPGVWRKNGEEAKSAHWKKLVNVGTISAAATIFLYLSDVKTPPILSDTLTYIGQTTTFLSMLVLGVSVAQMTLKDIFSHPKLYGFVLLRQIMLPVGCVLLLRPFLESQLLLSTTALMLAVPAGNMPLMLSKQLHVETDTISQGIILTTVLGLVTIPVVSLFL